MKIKTFGISHIVLSAFLIFVATSAHATPIAYDMELTITLNNSGAFNNVSVGSVFSADVNFDPMIGNTPGIQNGSNFYLDLNGSIFDSNNMNINGPFGFGAWDFAFNNPLPFSFIDPNFDDVIIDLFDPNSSLAIQMSTSSPDDITFRAFDAQGLRVDGSFVINQASVPEPATLALFGLGLAGIGFSRKKKIY